MESPQSRSLRVSEAKDVWVSICVGDYVNKVAVFTKEARYNTEIGIAEDQELPVAVKMMLDKCLTELALAVRAEVKAAYLSVRHEPEPEPRSD